MREILFRGKGNKRYNDGSWYYGVPIQHCDGDWQICTNNTKTTVLKNTIGQYSGLTDNNGKKIFEGDIVDVAYDVGYGGVAVERIGNFKVVFYKGCFMKKKIDGIGLFHFLPTDVTTVIGNIYDNPDLLDQKKECL